MPTSPHPLNFLTHLPYPTDQLLQRNPNTIFTERCASGVLHVASLFVFISSKLEYPIRKLPVELLSQGYPVHHSVSITFAVELVVKPLIRDFLWFLAHPFPGCSIRLSLGFSARLISRTFLLFSFRIFLWCFARPFPGCCTRYFGYLPSSLFRFFTSLLFICLCFLFICLFFLFLSFSYVFFIFRVSSCFFLASSAAFSAAFSERRSVGNGVMTAPWVMTALADRFLLIASLLPKEVYCRSRSKQSTFLATATPELHEIHHHYTSLALSTRCRRSYVGCPYCLASRRPISHPLSLRDSLRSSFYYFSKTTLRQTLILLSRPH